ncbi:MAG: phospholipid carrier-dependent glycosyltransferase [Chloroflexi bacterium]|nr:phospholipid carrier-dependent glycosyltransferase [Chloroflexota bacterium]
MSNPQVSSEKSKTQSASRERLPSFIVHYSLFIVAFLLRLAPLGRYITPDEPVWVYRAIRFTDALAARDWAAVPSTGHPGVTTMWLGSIGIAVQRLLAPTASSAHMDWIRRMAWLAPENGEAFRHLAFFLPWGRITVALITTLGLVALYPMLTRLFDRRVALLTVGLLAFDPFLVGHSGLLHTDALLATFTLLALTTAINGTQGAHRTVWWMLSGFFTGLAMLTKTPAVILPPFILLLCAIPILTRNSKLKIQNSQLVVHYSLFVASLFITVFTLYPALWVSTSDTFRTLSSFAEKHVGTVQRPIFFAGQTTYDPGPTFYPVVFFFRVSPLVLIGLAIGLVSVHRLPPNRRLTYLLLLTFAIGFGTLMNLGAKKHDRYLLPAFPPLTLAAALGWEHVRKRIASSQIIIPLIQLILTLPFAFYPLTAFNPFTGGPWGAERVLSTTWGEDMGAAARWLNQQPNAEQLTVAALSVPTFAAIFDGHTLPLDHTTLADYVVVSPNQATGQPIHAARFGFLDHVVVLTNTAPSEQSAYLTTHAGPDDLILLDAHTPLLRTYDGPGTLFSIADLPDQAAVTARLTELNTEHPQLWLLADPAAAPITAAHLRQAMNTIASPVSTATIASTTIVQYTNLGTRPSNPPARISTLGEYIALVDAILPDEPVNTPFPILLRWQALAPIPSDLHVSLHLRDTDGHLWTEVGHPVLNDVTFPTSAWAPYEWTDNILTLKPPERIPPATYALQLTLADSGGAQLGAWDADGQFQGVRVPLGDIEIAPPTAPVSQSLCEETQALVAGPLQTCASKLSPQTIPSGDMLTLVLTWSSASSPDSDYRIRWRLLDTTDSIALEQTVALSPHPTSNWRAGDSFDTRYNLRLDPALPATDYTLAFNILTPDGRPTWPQDEIMTIVKILPRDRLFKLPSDITHPLHLTLGNLIHLRGFDLDRTQAAPGGTLPITLYWQADGPTDLDYTIFIHLVGPDGRSYGQVDQFPGAGAAPTTSWALGQVTVDAINLPVAPDAPAGQYHVAFGMYNAASGGRLPITDASGRLLPDGRAFLPPEITITGGSQ